LKQREKSVDVVNVDICMYCSAFHFVSSGLSRFTSEANDYHAVSGRQINREITE